MAFSYISIYSLTKALPKQLLRRVVRPKYFVSAAPARHAAMTGTDRLSPFPIAKLVDASEHTALA